MQVQDTVFELVKELVPREGSILDVGCGHGKLARRLHEAGYRVSCFDKRIICEKLPGIEYLEGDLAQPMPYPTRSIDNIACTEVLEHLKSPYAALHEFSRILRKGGYLFLSIPNYWSVKHRLKYFLAGTMDRPVTVDANILQQYHENMCPHINTITWPTLKFALQAEGFEFVKLRAGNDYSLTRKLSYIPWALLIKIYHLAKFRDKDDALCLRETASAEVLYGGSRIAIVARKAENSP